MLERFKKIVRTNLWMKVLSVIIGALLWLFVQGEQRTQKSFDIDLEIENLSPNLIVSREFSRQVNIRLKGPKTRLSKLDESSIRSYILDFKEAGKGLNTFWIHEEDFKLPYGIEVTRVVPQLIRVELDRKRTRELTIKPRLLDQLEEGFELSEVSVIPQKIQVTGPEKSLNPLKTLNTIPISLSGRRESFEQELPIELVNSLFEISAKSAMLKVDIKEHQVTKKFKDYPVIAGGLGEFKIEPAQVSLKVTGLAGAVRDFVTYNTQVFVDTDKIFSDGAKKRVRVQPNLVNVPKGVEVVINPQSVLISKE